MPPTPTPVSIRPATITSMPRAAAEMSVPKPEKPSPIIATGFRPKRSARRLSVIAPIIIPKWLALKTNPRAEFESCKSLDHCVGRERDREDIEAILHVQQCQYHDGQNLKSVQASFTFGRIIQVFPIVNLCTPLHMQRCSASFFAVREQQGASHDEKYA